MSSISINLRGRLIECGHRKVSDISYTDNLPSITGDNSRFYTGYCDQCNEVVYARTGTTIIPWNYDRNETFKEGGKQ